MKVPPHIIAVWIMLALMAIIVSQKLRSPVSLMTPCGAGEIITDGPDGLPKCRKPLDQK